jgi:hypothetical protein
MQEKLIGNRKKRFNHINILNKLWEIIYVIFVKVCMKEDHVALLKDKLSQIVIHLI